MSPSKFRMDHIIWLPKLLLERTKEVICLWLGRSVGDDGPMKLHSLRYNCFKDLRLLIKLGKSVGNSVLERSKDLRGVF